MNKIVLPILFTSLIVASLLSCDKKTEVIGKNVTAPAYSKFNTPQPGDTIRTYYVKSTNDPFKIPIGITSVADKDRTIQLTYTSRTAVAGSQFNAPATIVIPAGKAADSLSISGLFAGYPVSSRIDTLKIQITGGDVPVNAYKSTFYLIMRKYCDVVINSFLGDYTRSYDRQGSGTPTGNYTAKITSITPTGATSATAIIYNFGDPMFGAPYNAGDLAITPGITINLDWADPANFKITVPTQAISESYYGPTGLIKAASTGPGTFSSCDNTFTVAYSFAIGSTSYGNFTTVLRR